MKYIFSIGLIFLIAACDISYAPAPSSTGELIIKLEAAKALNLAPQGLIGDVFRYGSNYTDLQRENMLSEINGKVVEWTLPVYEVERNGDGYKIQSGSGDGYVGTFVYIIPRDQREHEYVARIKTGDRVKIKGVINGAFMRNLNIEPAILVRPIERVAAEDNRRVGDVDDWLSYSNLATSIAATNNYNQINRVRFSKEDVIYLGGYIGMPAFSILDVPVFSEKIKLALGGDYDEFALNMLVSPPIERDGSAIIGSGIRPHQGGEFAAAFYIDVESGYVTIGVSDKKTGIVLYQDSLEKSEPLHKWYFEQVKLVAEMALPEKEITEIYAKKNIVCGVTRNGIRFVFANNYLAYIKSESGFKETNALIREVCS